MDETGSDVDTTDTTDAGQDELTVEVGGDEYEVTENYDYDQDGENDSAVVQTEDGYMAFHDTDGDGTADTMVELDADGNVTGAAEYDEASGEWTAADPNSVEAPSGGGADDAGADTTTGDDPTQTTETTTDTGSGEGMTVDTAEGEMEVGPAQYDSDGDGTNDTAVVTDEQGNTYAFVDTDADGEADEAVVIEADGDVTVAQHTAEDEWTTVETGHINADGSYTSDSASDAAWQG
ncbi:hypothetical protein [Actinokineospora sp. UTMC 2448]|uniref:hypothetical protein n=1 Tax=Actinokineospora sp. UTMC 2448 TaxID=2268449 RepID=UPI0021647822|nr:hypothetical protein [Actinokineospora sp. UTMC 2448]